MIKSVTGVILAGGKSSRIGTDKALLKIGKKTIIEQEISGIKNILEEIIVVVAEDKGQYNTLEARVVQDIIPSKGPLGGVYTGLVNSSSFYNLILACDMPFLQPNLVRHLLDRAGNYDAVVPECGGRLQPLCAVYSRNCIEPIRKEISRNNLKITDFLRNVKTNIITEKEVRSLDPEGLSFVNINTASDYQRLKRR
jgi:molybdopterin-guanine dinucleotide biosynthesis protein A